jgi:hypothetical protein
MPTPCIDDYKQLCTVLKHIPKRARAKMKRKIKVHALETTPGNRSEVLRAYRRSWHTFAAAERAREERKSQWAVHNPLQK